MTVGKSDAVGRKEVKPDFSRIVPYTPADDEEKPTTIRNYSNGEKTLLYINASHVSGVEAYNPASNPTFDKIREAVETQKPQRIVIESSPGLPANEGEPAFAEALGRSRNIPVIHGEPDGAAIFKGLEGTGYSAKDVMAMYLLRTIPRDRDEKLNMDEPHFAERAKRYLEAHPDFASIAPEDRLTYEQFKAEYAPRLGKHFLDAVTNDSAPYTMENANFFQKVSSTVARVREGLVDTTIANNLNEPGVDTVLVIYGGAHRTISGPVWDAALGKGEDLPEPIKNGTLFVSWSDREAIRRLEKAAHVTR